MKYLKNFLCMMLAFVLVFSMVSMLDVSVFASDASMDGVGTTDNPYVIKNAVQLDQVRNNLSGSYILGANIDLSSISNWTPIGTESNPFTGTFNGNGYVVSNVVINVSLNENTLTEGSAYMGFFGYTNGATIVNLGIEKASYTITSGDFSSGKFSNAGGIVAVMNNTIIEQCYFDGKINNNVGKNIYSRAAGISAIGINSTVTDTYCNVDIYANAYNMNTMAAGLVAWLDSVTVNRCYVTGSVVGENTKGPSYVGGGNSSGNASSIFGYIISYGGTVKNSVFMLDVLNANGTTNYKDSVGNFSEKLNNKIITSSSDEAIQQKIYENLGWNFEKVWLIESGYPILQVFKNKEHESSNEDIVNILINSYIQQHLDFIESSEYQSLINNASFYYNVMKHEDDSAAVAYGLWEYLGDMGEIATLKFNDLMICDNPYDLILSDIFTNYATVDNFSSAVNLGIIDGSNELYDTLLNVLKSRKEWDESYNKKLEIEIKGMVFEPNYKVKDTHAYETIKKLINGMISDNQLESIFVGLKKADVVYDYINNGADIVNNFISAYNAYIAAMGYIEAKNDILSTLIVAGYEMDQICGAYYIASLSTYLSIEDEDDAFDFALGELMKDTAWTTYDLIAQKLFQQGVYKFVAEALGTTAGTIGIVTFAYNTTYKVLDFITANGDKGDLYKVMYAAAKLEEVLLDNSKAYANSLKNDPVIDKAKLFDASWGLLKNIENYSFQILSQYAAKSKISTRFLNFFNKDYVSDDMTAPLYLASVWNGANCHNSTPSLIYKVVSVKCPTDVYIKLNEERQVEITENRITANNKYIVGMVVGDEKYISLPITNGHLIKIEATGDGSMTYSVSEYDDLDLVRYVKYKDIPLLEKQDFSGRIDNELFTNEINYDLLSGNTVFHCSFDSLWGIHNDGDNHIFTKYVTDNNATCQKYGTKTASCDNNCGATHTVVDNSCLADHQWQEATCATAKTCSVCGATEGESNGHKPDREGHATEDYAIKCSICGYEIEAQLAHDHIYNMKVVNDTYKVSDATCKSKAVYYKSCRCGEKGTETFKHGEFANHTPDSEKATETKSVKCLVCGFEIAPAIEHPQTGDSNHLIVWIVLFAVSMMAFVLNIFRRVFLKKNE
ncbi:MAG: hypothetical protein IKJ59_03180 [Clostridia bacterium]|nr:hypothetical protein [Clostridia bacterium]